VSGIAISTPVSAPCIVAGQVERILPGFDLWDYWPVQELDGRTAPIADGTLYMLLSAPILPDPDGRHAVARIRLMYERRGAWRDLGNLLPDRFSPGSREWSGSAFVDRDRHAVTLYFTAAGRRGEASLGFEQRIFETRATLSITNDVPQLANWSPPIELFRPDAARYAADMTGGGAIGTIKAFRDPYWFRDPADDAEHIVFTASLAASASPWNGAIGSASRTADGWRLSSPLISADGLNNELERPHIIRHEGRYYCFWSTQRKVFDPAGPQGPTGLYGMVAEAFAGPWRPLNGTGLVFANPDMQPLQAYSWQVLHDLSVISFIDRPGLDAEPSDPAIARAHFGGTPAPVLRLTLDGDRAALA